MILSKLKKAFAGVLNFVHLIAQKVKFSIKDFFSKCDQICSLLRI